MADERSLLDTVFTTAPMHEVFDDQAHLQGLLDFEAGLARVQSRCGVIPQAAAAPIVAQCQARYFNRATLDAASAGNTAIPLVKALTARVEATDAKAARYVHWGATSQDAMDTGLVLQLRKALALLDIDLSALSETLAKLADRHRATVLPGRTWLQQALPVTLGLKVAGWLSAVERHRQRLTTLRPRALVLQFGGAAGTLAALGGRGMEVAEELARTLDLSLPQLPWHTERDTISETATLLGLVTGTLGKMARDLSLLMQTEVGEVREPTAPGRGGSSTMPHKRNPVACAITLSAAVRAPALVSTLLSAMVQEHERGLGGWHAEWQTLPELFCLTAGALKHMRTALEGLEIDAEAMSRNLDATGGQMMAESLMMALADKIGRQSAHEAVREACERAAGSGSHLRAVVENDEALRRELTEEELDRLFDPSHYLGETNTFIDRTLAARDPPPTDKR